MAQAMTLYRAERHADAEAEARARAVSAHDACLAAFGPDHRRTVEARALLDRIDGT
ncbi:hypothetical protein GCM10010266_04220 [Streptomyces griseomycini]|uniref:hypothetical protein n=1 Tax=Streptomyces griseomycini TaxID=66895 RepID=UPI0019AB28D7|nr:hypothetical protein [Streptomyces griseomycini]GGP85161.1 hypothetical protein GCM10010266_04220 [Streptomyces griseomycini]